MVGFKSEGSRVKGRGSRLVVRARARFRVGVKYEGFRVSGKGYTTIKFQGEW